MFWQFVVLTIGAYLLGAVPAAYLAVKWTRGVDIRKIGTGKVGASNVFSAGPKWAVIPVAIFDIGKGALVVWIAKVAGLNGWEQVAVGFGAIIGHNWPIYLGFKSGGRGVFASLGVIFALSWQVGLFALIFPYLFAPIKQVALGVFIAYLLLAPVYWLESQLTHDSVRNPIVFVLIAIAILGISRRLIAHRNEISKKSPWRVVIMNRLLFDRDIRDRKVWISNGNGAH
ncbi:MAG: glycerol-3-phosphate acyltransferase [Dehalococcoidales bacterium]|nr:glycerol-3-phosphate acyltransferase [Dehalococcoidales bacterium]